MVASGLPIRNGNNHAYEIAKMSLDMIHCVATVSAIGDKTDDSVQLRVGIHSGKLNFTLADMKSLKYSKFPPLRYHHQKNSS